MRFQFLIISIFLFSNEIQAQGCCSGGGGNPIVGGASRGVLKERQIEIAANYQYISTDKFKVGDKNTAALFKNFNSNYLYFRLAYGLTKSFTMSVETGYYINKTQIGFDNSNKISSSGIADLILFPRYNLLNRSSPTRRTELTFGLGFKIPLGKYSDSTVVYTNPVTNKKYYTISPPTVQPTNGSNDFIFYSFLYRGYPVKDFRVFSSMLYIRKGWNPLGQKYGDYASIGLFAGKTFFNKLGVTLQLKGEFVAKMKYDKNIDMLALYNITVTSTGSRKLFLVPQLNYSHKNFNLYTLIEIPLYQYVNETQIATKIQASLGISYLLFAYKSPDKKTDGLVSYICPMKCEGSESKEPGKCKVCGMDLIKK